MKKTKTQKGITLVALIITIVVLLILAAVAIGAIKDNNIIAHAQNAASIYNEAKANEITSISKYENLIEPYITKESLESYTFKLSEIMQKGNESTDITRIIPVGEFWPENASENLKNNAFNTTGYFDEFETVFASNFTCSDSKFVNPFAVGGSQYWNEDTCCYLMFPEEEGNIFLIVQIDGRTVTESNYIELGLEKLEFTISVPSK